MNNVLVIDDDDSIRRILRVFLVSSGYAVAVANNGENGIVLFDKHEFDIVITDIRMPLMDGNQVAEHIRKSDKSDTPIVAITGYPDEVRREMFDFMIVKPFILKDLPRIIESVVGRRTDDSDPLQ